MEEEEEGEEEEEEESGNSFGCSVVLCVCHGSLSRARFRWTLKLLWTETEWIAGRRILVCISRGFLSNNEYLDVLRIISVVKC